jgi:hypothetical protein
VAGGFGAAGFVAVEGFVSWQMTASGADRDEMVRLLERFNDSGATFLPTALPMLAFQLALGPLGIALLRARTEPRWAAMLIVASRAIVLVAFVCSQAAGEQPMPVIAAADLLLLVAFAGIGLHLVRRAQVGTPARAGAPLMGSRRRA